MKNLPMLGEGSSFPPSRLCYHPRCMSRPIWGEKLSASAFEGVCKQASSLATLQESFSDFQSSRGPGPVSSVIVLDKEQRSRHGWDLKLQWLNDLINLQAGVRRPRAEKYAYAHYRFGDSY